MSTSAEREPTRVDGEVLARHPGLSERAVPPTRGLADWIGLAANVGALIGLLLVVVQLRQNRDLTRAQVRHELSSGIVSLLLESATDAQLSSVMRRASIGETLSPDELFQFRMRSNALLRYWEDVHYQYRQGLYDEEEFERQKEAWRDSIKRSKGMQTYWCEVRPLYSRPFAAEIDGVMPAGACEVR